MSEAAIICTINLVRAPKPTRSSTMPTTYIIKMLMRNTHDHSPTFTGIPGVRLLSTSMATKKASNMQGRKATPPRRGMAL